MNEVPPIMSDRDCLVAWRRARQLDALLVLGQRYGAFVYGASLRRAGDNAVQAAEISRAVFLVLARRGRRLSSKTVLAPWLFGMTALAARKSQPSRWWPWPLPWRWRKRRDHAPTPVDANAWTRLAPAFDSAVDRLWRRRREAFLLHYVLGLDVPETARLLRTSEHRAEKRAQAALKALAKQLRKQGGGDSEVLAREVAEHARPAVPDELSASIRNAMAEALSARPRQKLARRVLNSLGIRRWRRRLLIGAAAAVVLVASAIVAVLHSQAHTGYSRLIALFLELRARSDAFLVEGLAVPAKPWPAADGAGGAGVAAALDASQLNGAADLYRTTNIWPAHLSFSPVAWDATQPKRIETLPHFIQADGSILLRNPKARRSGLAGVLGFEFDWTQANLEVGGARFTNVAVRAKGNGTYLLSLYGEKRAFKVDLNKYVKGQKLAGLNGLVFNNLVADSSFLQDSLAYEFFRDAGVPASRTAFAYLSVSVAGRWERKPLGLYVMVEPVDSQFAAERFGSRRVAILKPVTYRLFEYSGDDWSGYAEEYDAKTELTPGQQRRIIEFARLVSKAGDTEFAAQLGEFLDLEAFARFLAGQVILSNYDGVLMDGQNFYLYVDPKSQKFGFIPWDLDLSWGGFQLWLTEERERASIWHPWVGENRFIERVMAVEEFKKLYRASLEDYLARLFVPERLERRIDELAQGVRPAIAAESGFRLGRFEQAVTDHWLDPPIRGGSEWADAPVHQLKRFIRKRAHFVRQQLDGKSRGMILKRPVQQ
jgi:DNA-directed RNA polymerase specialized sigma24 family protein